MSRRQPAEESPLFDLPLERPLAEPAPAVEIEQPRLPLTVAEDPHAAEPSERDAPHDGPLPVETPTAASRRRGGPAPVTLRQRAAGGVIDLGVCAAVLVLLLVALLAQGVRPEMADWPAGALFLLTFSFLYAVLPLAFWGRTPGMSLVGLRAASSDGGPLTFRQAVLAWLAAVLTVALVGLPLLLALGGRSLGNLISGSVTRRLRRPV
jgi:uncharacterized RDD family membrane protein YckC